MSEAQPTDANGVPVEGWITEDIWSGKPPEIEPDLPFYEPDPNPWVQTIDYGSLVMYQNSREEENEK